MVIQTVGFKVKISNILFETSINTLYVHSSGNLCLIKRTIKGSQSMRALKMQLTIKNNLYMKKILILAIGIHYGIPVTLYKYDFDKTNF